MGGSGWTWHPAVTVTVVVGFSRTSDGHSHLITGKAILAKVQFGCFHGCTLVRLRPGPTPGFNPGTTANRGLTGGVLGHEHTDWHGTSARRGSRVGIGLAGIWHRLDSCTVGKRRRCVVRLPRGHGRDGVTEDLVAALGRCAR